MVARYRCTYYGYSSMEPDDHGYWIRYHDYARLRAAVEEALELANPHIDDMQAILRRALEGE